MNHSGTFQMKPQRNYWIDNLRCLVEASLGLIANIIMN